MKADDIVFLIFFSIFLSPIFIGIVISNIKAKKRKKEEGKRKQWQNEFIKEIAKDKNIRQDIFDEVIGNEYKKLIEHSKFHENSDLFICALLADSYSNKLIADACDAERRKYISINFPLVAKLAAELKTLYLDSSAELLNWGHNKARERKVESIRDLKKKASALIEEANLKSYQLDYLLDLFPQLQDFLDSSSGELCFDVKNIEALPDHDTVQDFLSLEEYRELSISERNQLALDRYVEQRRKTKWQIGRDYELYIGYLLESKGWKVEYSGSQLKLQDLGRDLIAHKGSITYIIQCKYWSKEKVIHEKHIAQLFGTLTEYRLSNPLISEENIVGVFVTSTVLSDMAHRFAEKLGIKVRENKPLGDFPRIKCNINRDKYGNETKIYHLPMDMSYDSAKIDKDGEFMAMTVKEAEEAGFRRSYKWHGVS